MAAKNKLNPLTKEMQKCLDFIKEKGHIYRHTGGFWAAEDDPREGRLRASSDDKEKWDDGYFHHPINYYGAGTIKALERRELIEPTEFQTSFNGKSSWPIRYVLRSS